LQNNRRLARS